ncbi:HPr family phosphocarrier protein [bacterium]|nr:MAG: HPr family phosphocarrier protein [candidate division KSB1 bacterium]MCE7942790.1 HPr family phosphocarrier protein [Chlorobi bacterium CHB1]MCL4703907.1 HPr family phosphocarrier protein [bacterium]MDL1876955.1 HPr family phosphocarrier protein [Cytophagia bacterium CHB2]RIK75162.1 MAG: phosphocarrier protein HPr [candidate division KSB1 bacterium]
MLEKKVRVQNKLGLHARPAALLVKTANKFKADVFLTRESQVVNGKSIMGVMMLAANYGSEITLSVKGEDEESALTELSNLFDSKFGEQ